MIDVNVHPQKTEIRFKDERWVFATIWETIQTSLSGLRMISAPAEVDNEPVPETADFPELRAENSQDDSSVALPTGSIFTPPPAFSQPLRSNPGSDSRTYELKEYEQEKLGPRSVGAVSSFEPGRTLKKPRILAQLKNSYLLGEDEDGLFIIDQHAAHERILFDQYSETYRDMPIAAQPLLFPVPLKLLPSERMIIKEQTEELKSLGFTLQQEDDGQFYAIAVPVPDRYSSENQTLQHILSQVLNGWESRSVQEVKTDLLKLMACKAAVKAGDPLEASEWNSLLEQLLKTENPFTCPHGRPIVIRLTTRQIEAGFLRT
jgi:DNA mismatch repair protein MutL